MFADVTLWTMEAFLTFADAFRALITVVRSWLQTFTVSTAFHKITGAPSLLAKGSPES